MSKRLKNLYAHLIQNRKHNRIGWYNEYKVFMEDISIICTNLGTHSIRANQTYAGTSFAKSAQPFDDFIKKLIYNHSNGISSRGRSVISAENLEKFKLATGFDEIIKNIIINPNLTSYDALKTWWQNQKMGNNPVLINRAMAACTKDISNTVDEGKFNQVFYWLQSEGLINPYPASNLQDWYSKNTFIISELTTSLAGVPDIDHYWISIFLWDMYVNLSNPFSLKKQIVKYGSPGTGKTYSAKQNTKLLFEIWKDEFSPNGKFDFNEQIEIIQFHPSYTYEDFLEGLRPKLDANNQAQLVLQNGVFKKFCINAGKWESDFANLSAKHSITKNWSVLTINDLVPYQHELDGEHWKHIFDLADKTKKVAGAVPPFFFIIDEINRAELSRVFGELMFCLEYRGVKGAIKTQYVNLNDNKTGMIKLGKDYQFFIPFNVYIIGTMNTIDRSVESFDFALRRRFRWEEVVPDINLLYYHLLSHNLNWIGLSENLKNLNLKIENEPLLGRDFQIGHAYLWDLPYSKDLTITEIRSVIWENSIESLLQEYLRGSGREDLMKTFAKEFGIQ